MMDIDELIRQASSLRYDDRLTSNRIYCQIIQEVPNHQLAFTSLGKNHFRDKQYDLAFSFYSIAALLYMHGLDLESAEQTVVFAKRFAFADQFTNIMTGIIDEWSSLSQTVCSEEHILRMRSIGIDLFRHMGYCKIAIRRDTSDGQIDAVLADLLDNYTLQMNDSQFTISMDPIEETVMVGKEAYISLVHDIDWSQIDTFFYADLNISYESFFDLLPLSPRIVSTVFSFIKNPNTVDALEETSKGVEYKISNLDHKLELDNDKKEEISKQNQCFVATAVFGSYDHPSVRVLRRFRDESLLTTKTGAYFVKVYYQIGPYAANIIRLRIMRPIHWIVKTLLIILVAKLNKR